VNKDLVLVPLVKSIEPLTTAVLYSRQARAYLKIASAKFNRLVKTGVFNQYTHIDGRRPVFLKHELDLYLRSLPRHRMKTRVSPNPGGEEQR
jgi:hypothetical protein